MILGLGYALGLYYREKTFRDQAPWLTWLLGILRFLMVTIASALLLSPLLRSLQTETKKPLVILAQDNSESVAAAMTEEQQQTYRQYVEALAKSLSDEYEFKEYSFGSEVREGIDFSYGDKVTNISEVFNDIYDLYSNQNLGAVVLATDGIYNEGSNPVYSGNKLGVPVFTVALGDTTPKRDVILKRVFHNRIAYLGDKFSVQIDVSALNCSASATTLSVSKVEGNNVRRLQEIPISIDRNDFFTTQEVILDADPAGVQRFRISLSPVSNEVSTVNNTKDIFIDVLDARQKVLVLANSPHPDITALRQSLTSNENYEVEVAYIANFTDPIAEYDMVILHQLPSIGNSAEAVINEINNRKIPVLYIVGGQTDINRFNRVQSLLTIRAGGANSNEVQARVVPGFNLFTIGEAISGGIGIFPPLIAPFGDFSVGANSQALLRQRIGRIDTDYPLLVLGTDNEARAGVLAAEGIWKWRLFDYLQHQNQDIFDELLGKTIQYVGLKEDKRRFRVSMDKNIFNENEPVIFDGELYNDNYELINDPDVSMSITDEDGKEYDYVFNRINNAYTLNAGILPVGNYRFTANTVATGESLEYNGQFTVQPIQLELFESTADHRLLQLISDQFGGSLVAPNDVASLADRIAEKETVAPVIYQSVATRSVINLKWIFFLLLVLLTAEWFLRRYFGGY
ncbi:hypothetical protein [Flavilitoribacter nigricans]|uniref:hypothetical protein n=1 Tax=Flavilitoribacter nigricans TaxID=70997 RepID=UPI001F1ED142|nr:hypothetical protein [Flavilitoribacter nigricans]